jgi:hypothetical protein
MAYSFTTFTPQVIFVQLLRFPTDEECMDFLAQYRTYILDVPTKVYFIVDFRKGMFTNIKMLHESAKLSTHPNFGASIGFGGDAFKSVFADVFAERVQQDVPKEMFQTREQAVAELERLLPKALEGVDWKSIIPA